MQSSHVHDVTTADFPTAVVERSHHVPVLVDFWATWCGPCRALGPILEKLAGEFSGGFELVKVDTDAEQALASEFQIRSIPTVMLFRDGARVAGFPGALPEGQIRRFLAEHGVEPGAPQAVIWSSDPVERVQQLRATVAEHPERASLQLDLAVALSELGMDHEAALALEALPIAVYGDPKAKRARALVALRAIIAERPADDAVRSGGEAILRGDATVGFSLLLEALREDKTDEHSPARRALVESLHVIDDEDAVRDARRRMASVLF